MFDSASGLPSLINDMFVPNLSLEHLEWKRSVWPGKLFVKGVITSDDALRMLPAEVVPYGDVVPHGPFVCAVEEADAWPERSNAVFF